MFVMNKKRNENPIYIYIAYTGASHLKKLEYHEKFFFFLLISKCETFINSRFIACKEKHFKMFLFVLILAIRAYSSWK